MADTDQETLEPQAPPEWDDVKDHFSKAYPELDPGMMQQHYEQARQLTLAHQRAPSGETTGEFLGRRSIPFMSSIVTVAEDEAYMRAKDRLLKFQTLPGDYDVAARYEKRKEGQEKQGLGMSVLDSLAHLPAIAGEAYAAAPLTAGLPAGGGVGGAALRLGARGVVQTPAMPSLYAGQASQRAVAGQAKTGEMGEATDPKNLAPAMTMGAVQNMVFGSLGELPLVGRISNPGVRFGAKVVAGMAEQQGMDAAAGALDDSGVLPDAYKTNTGYGLIGEIMQGKSGDALKNAVVQAVTFSAFTAMHGNKREAKQIIDKTKELLDHQAENKVPADQAAIILGRIVPKDETQMPGFMRGGPRPPEQPPEAAPAPPQAPAAAPEAPPSPPAMIDRPGGPYADTPRMRALVAKADALRASLPAVEDGKVRLWRGNRLGEIGKNPSFTTSLEGIAMPFQEGYGGKLSYVDVPKEDLPKYAAGPGATDAEFRLPSELAKQAKEATPEDAADADLAKWLRSKGVKGKNTEEVFANAKKQAINLDALRDAFRRPTAGLEPPKPAPQAPISPEPALEAPPAVTEAPSEPGSIPEQASKAALRDPRTGEVHDVGSWHNLDHLPTEELKQRGRAGELENGFITDRGRFVTSEEGNALNDAADEARRQRDAGKPPTALEKMTDEAAPKVQPKPVATKPLTHITEVSSIGEHVQELLDRIDRGEGNLTARQKAIIKDRLLPNVNKGFRELGREHGVSQTTIENEEKRSLAALGLSGSVDELHAFLAPDTATLIKAIKNQNEALKNDMEESGVKPSKHDPGADIQKELDAKTSDWMRELGKKHPDPEKLKEIKSEIEKLESDFRGAERGGVQPTPIRRAPGSRVPSGPTPLQPAPPSPGAPRGDSGPEATGGAEAVGQGAPSGPGAAGAAALRGAAGADKLKPKERRAQEQRDEAREHGVDVEAARTHAQEVMAENREYVDENNRLLKRAREALARFGVHVGTSSFKKKVANGEIDSAAVAHLDEVAKSMAAEFPEHFAGGPQEGEDPLWWTERLFDVVAKGKLSPMTEDVAFTKAVGNLADRNAYAKEIADVQQKTQAEGLAPEVASRLVGETQIEGEREVEAEGERHETGDTSFDPSELETPKTFGAPLTEAEKQMGVMGGGQENAPSAEQRTPKWTTALANARMDAERESHGLPRILAEARLADTEVWDRAMAKLDADPNAASDLVKDLVRKNRSTTVEENALLLWQKVALRNEHTRAMKQYLEAVKPKNREGYTAQQIDAMGDRAEELFRQIDELDKVTHSAGTEWGRAGRYRRILAAEDFSLAGMLLRAQTAAKRPLTEQETAKIAKQAQDVEDAQKEQGAAEESLAALKGGEAAKIGSKLVQTPEFKTRDAAAEKVARLISGYESDVAALKQQAKPWTQRVLDAILDWRRAFLLSNPATLAKIGLASGYRVGIAPMEEAAGSGLRLIPGLSKIAALSAREGKSFSGTREAMAAQDAFSKGLVDSWQTLRTGQSELKARFGGRENLRTWPGMISDIHAAIKQPAARAEYSRAQLMGLDDAIARGEDVTNVAVLTKIQMEAYKHSERAIFMNDGATANAVGEMLKSKYPAWQTAKKFLVPISKVPTNIAVETMQYTVGLATGSAHAGYRLATGLKGLQPGEADLIMRQLKKGSLGGALLLAGILRPDYFGGYYQPGRKKEDELKPGEVRTPAGDVPGWASHNPLLAVAQVGATIRKVSDKKYRGEEQGPLEGSAAAAMGMAGEIPLVRETADIGKLQDPHERGYIFGEWLKGVAEPQLMQWLAKRTDTTDQPGVKGFVAGKVTPRSPEGLGEHMKMGVPGLRQQVKPRSVGQK